MDLITGIIGRTGDSKNNQQLVTSFVSRLQRTGEQKINIQSHTAITISMKKEKEKNKAGATVVISVVPERSCIL